MVPLIGCGCMFTLLAASVPRVTLLFLWIFTPLVDKAFATFIGPLLGLAFLPYTTLMYVIVYPAVSFGWFWVGAGLVIDISSYAASARSNRDQIEGYPFGGNPANGYPNGYPMEPSYGYGDPGEW